MSTKLHRNPPFKAEHLGSLLRPEDLLTERAAVDNGKSSDKELQKVEDRSIDEIVDLQLKLGFHGVSDGEYRRHMFWGSFFPGLEGFENVYAPDPSLYKLYSPDAVIFVHDLDKIPKEALLCTGKIKHVGSTYIPQWEYLKSKLPADRVHEAKLTLPAPNWYHFRYTEGRAYPKDVYPNDEAYFADIAKAYQAELNELYSHGLRNVQFDDPNLAYFCDEKMLKAWGEDSANTKTPDQLLDAYIEMYNECISKIPDDMHVGVHLCRGNFVGSRHFSEGSYDRIATKLFTKMNMHTFYLEYDTPRAGGFEPLAHVPTNKNVILGVITSKFPKLEDKEEMKNRVLQAAEIMAKGSGQDVKEVLKRVGISPQCGFASHAGGNALGREDMKKKLQLVRELANDIWPEEP